MKIRCGYNLSYRCSHAVPMHLLLGLHPSRERDLVTEQVMRTDPALPSRVVLDHFGNRLTRLVAPPGEIHLSADFVVADSGLPDAVDRDAQEIPVDRLPDDVLIYLMGSRYADTDLLGDIAWSLFGGTPRGWERVQAIVDYVHNRIRFDYQLARATRTASEGHREQVGVCRDFAHLAVSLCRCMNIPARYCTGYLGDIGVPAVDAPMDWSAWFEVYLRAPGGITASRVVPSDETIRAPTGIAASESAQVDEVKATSNEAVIPVGPLSGRWYTFDARHNVPRIGRIVMARGRDATDVAISTAFGSAVLGRFEVITEEVRDATIDRDTSSGHFSSGGSAASHPCR